MDSEEHGRAQTGVSVSYELPHEPFDWFEERLGELGSEAYVLSDLPGQVTLSTNHESEESWRSLSSLGFGVHLWQHA